jgi:hypothetical protein
MNVQPDVVIRTARSEDSADCGQICYAAFSAIMSSGLYNDPSGAWLPSIFF